ncbi:MAG TPA: hypothetical protein GXZ30_00535 [Propionibacterium sp.]|nr:hypothetical protein [Propionibacterium sp.]
MSDPKKPGPNAPGPEPDTTMIRPASDIVGQNKETGGKRADRVRDWVNRNNPSSGPDQSSGAGSEPTLRVPSHERAQRGTEPKAGQQVFRAGGSTVAPEAHTETTVLKDQPSAESDKESPRASGGFMSKVKKSARTVSTGVVGAAAGAMGGEEAETAVSGVPAPDPETTRRPGAARRTRKARLRLSQIDPWSVMKTAFLFSVAAGIVLWVATGTIWAVISASGMFEEINKIVGGIIQTPGDDTPFRIQDYINTSKVMGTAAFIAVIDVVIFTALATLGAFLYNLASAMIGGLEVTLAED